MPINYNNLLDQANEYYAATFLGWNNNSLSFTFLNTLPDYYAPIIGGVISVGVVNFDLDKFTFRQAQKEAAKFILNNSQSGDSYEYALPYRASFSDVATITFTESVQSGTSSSGVGQITYSNANLVDGNWGSSPLFPTFTDLSGDVFIGNIPVNQDEYLYLGGTAFWVILHETAHAVVGFEDVGDPNQSGNQTSLEGTIYDDYKYTIMSYSYQIGSPDGLRETDVTDHADGFQVMPYGLQLLDIAATQEEFEGRNYITRDDNTIYGAATVEDGFRGFAPLGVGKPFIYTIWDGKGIDQIDVSGFDVAAQIDLRQGAFSSIGRFSADPNVTSAMLFDDTNSTNGDEGNVAIAFYTVIENATGTAQNDYLIGNAWNNVLSGGDGDDTLYGDGVSYDDNAGFHEVDEYRAWNETDNLAPDDNDSGNDILIGGEGNDVLHGGLGDDVLHGGFKASDINAVASGWDSAGHFSELDDIAYASDGSDIATYASLTEGITVTATSATTLTVAKGEAAALGTDHLYSVEGIWGSNGDDTFNGVKDGSIYYRGQNGFDTYNFDVAVDRGYASILDNGGKGTDLLKILNVGENILISDGPYPGEIVFSQIQPDPEYPAVPLLVLYVNGIDRVELNGAIIGEDELFWIAHTNANASNLPTVSAIYDLIYNGGVSENDAGGGVAPEYDGGGEIKSLEVRPDITGRYMDYAYTNEYLHPFIITNYVGGPGGSTMTFDTYLQGIEMVEGISAEDVRFTVNSSSGDADLTIHIDALGESHTIQDYEAGKTLSGIATYDAGLHSWVQNLSDSLLESNGGKGKYKGTYTQEYVLNTGLVEVTYFLEDMYFANDPSIDLQGQMTFTGTNTGDTLYGLDTRGDIIKGLDGKDSIRAYGGDDTLIGGAERDVLYGGQGNDLYIFEAGFGGSSPDIVNEELGEGTDTIHFGSGITAEDIFSWSDGYGRLYLQLADFPGDTLYIAADGSASNSTDVNERVERITFDDATVWDLTQGLILHDSGDGHDLYASDANDTLHGNGGDDRIKGFAGNDIINGGAGRDLLYGGTGDDTYVFEAGFGGGSPDIVNEELNEGTDTLHFGGGITAEDIYGWSDGDRLYLQLAGSPGDTLYINANGSASNSTDVNERVERITFDDATVWDLTQGLILHDSGDGHDLYASDANDTLHGNGGDDRIKGFAGNDIINGGAGRDLLYGGTGDDTYVFEAGFGGGSPDIIYEELNEGTDTLHFGGGITAEDIFSWSGSNGRLYLQLADSPGDTLYIDGAYSSSTGVNIGGYVEYVTFDDATMWDLTQGLHLRNNDTARTLYGSAQNDVIEGGAANDTLRGFAGDDWLTGHGGNDALWGYDGADTFAFMAADVGNGIDTLRDFDMTEGDVIDLRDVLDGGYDPMTNALADFVQFTNDGDDSVLAVDLDGAGTVYGWTQIATVYDHNNLDADVLATNGYLLAA